MSIAGYPTPTVYRFFTWFKWPAMPAGLSTFPRRHKWDNRVPFGSQSIAWACLYMRIYSVRSLLFFARLRVVWIRLTNDTKFQLCEQNRVAECTEYSSYSFARFFFFSNFCNTLERVRENSIVHILHSLASEFLKNISQLVKMKTVWLWIFHAVRWWCHSHICS